MITHNDTPSPLKEGRAKHGSACPMCGHSHALGTMCSYDKSLSAWLEKANTTANRGHNPYHGDGGLFTSKDRSKVTSGPTSQSEKLATQKKQSISTGKKEPSEFESAPTQSVQPSISPDESGSTVASKPSAKRQENAEPSEKKTESGYNIYPWQVDKSPIAGVSNVAHKQAANAAANSFNDSYNAAKFNGMDERGAFNFANEKAHEVYNSNIASMPKESEIPTVKREPMGTEAIPSQGISRLGERVAPGSPAQEGQSYQQNTNNIALPIAQNEGAMMPPSSANSSNTQQIKPSNQVQSQSSVQQNQPNRFLSRLGDVIPSQQAYSMGRSSYTPGATFGQEVGAAQQAVSRPFQAARSSFHTYLKPSKEKKQVEQATKSLECWLKTS